jgi:hypothetical protein
MKFLSSVFLFFIAVVTPVLVHGHGADDFMVSAKLVGEILSDG